MTADVEDADASARSNDHTLAPQGDGATDPTDGGGDNRLATLVLLAGLVLFFVPEPTTSLVGLLLALVGVVGLLVGRLGG